MTALLTDNLPLLAGAPNGIKKLRELILELAVRGKLVPQDPNDKPACELLKRIAEEKARLVAEGKIKKQKALAAIGGKEGPFDLPNGWVSVPLMEIAALVTDGDHQPPPKAVEGVPFLVIGNLNTGRVCFDDCRRVPADYFAALDWGRKPTRGDILYTVTGSFGIAVMVDVDDPFCVQRHVAIIKVSRSSPSAYLKVLLGSPYAKSYAELIATGIAQKTVPLTGLRQLVVPLPPLAEQHRIVAKVDELMAICDRLEAQQADPESAHAQLVQALLGSLIQEASAATDLTARDGGNAENAGAIFGLANWQRLAEHFHTLFTTEPSIDALKQTLLQLAVMGKLVPQNSSEEPAIALVKRIQAEKQRYLAVSKARKQKDLATDSRSEPPFEIPVSWEWQTIDDVLHVTGGVTLGRKLGGRKLLSKPYLRVANVQRGRLELDHIKEVEVPEDEVEKYLLQSGDLLITEGGDWDKVGRTATWRDELPECLHQNHVFRARAVVADWEPRWAEMYLNSATAREYFAGSSKQTTNLASINMTQLRACAFPLPPLAEQHRIVAKVDQLMALCDQVKNRLTQARQLNEQLASTLVEQAVA